MTNSTKKSKEKGNYSKKKKTKKTTKTFHSFINKKLNVKTNVGPLNKDQKIYFKKEE